MDTDTPPTNDITDEPREMPPLLTVTQAATLMGMSVRATYRAVEADAIPHIRIGHRITIPTAKLLRDLGLPTANVRWRLE